MPRIPLRSPGATGVANRIRHRPAAAAWGWGVVAILAGVGGATARGASTPWGAMDYGPFLTASIEAPAPRTNIAYKGIALKLAQAPGAGSGESVVFDTDLLRYAAGWNGRFVALKGVVFDGEHWAYPQIDGSQWFGNPVGPGWARPGTDDFRDPRPQPFGPLPRTWAHWQGLYLHGATVVLSYRVGDMPVLERSTVESVDDLHSIVRTLNLGPSTTDQTVQIVQESRRAPIFQRSADGRVVGEAEAAAAPEETVVWLEAPMVKQAASKVMAPPDDGLLGRWDFDGDGAAALKEGSGAGRSLTLRGARPTEGGRHGGGLAFSAGQHAEVSGAEDLDLRRRDLTVGTWLRTRADGVIFAKTAASAEWVPGGAVLFVRGGQLTLDVGWVGAVSSTATVADGAWHHVTWTWQNEEGVARLFVDGRLDGERSLKPQAALASHVARVGFGASNFPASPWLEGELDELRIYGRALDPREVAALAGPPERDSSAPLVGVSGTPKGSRWVTDGEAGFVRLRIPAHAEPVRLKVFVTRADPGRAVDLAAMVGRSPTAEDLAPLTRGGPARWGEKLTTQGKAGAVSGPFAIDELTAPDDNPWKSWLRFGALDFFADGRRAAISTWNGDVWVVTGVDGSLEKLTWQRIATGLFQPLGLKIVDDEIYVLGRDQITRLHDLNGDGEADFYENFNNDCLVSEHFHEFATDLKLGPDGDFYYIKCARHALPAAHAHHGSLLRVARDGSKLEVVARGFRAVNGLGVGPHGEFTTIDNQGHWMPANRLNWVKPGGWYGNQWAWNPDQRSQYDEPLCWMHNFVDRSGGTQLWVPDDRWGPLKDELITLSYGMGHMFLVLKEQVGDVMQGAVTRFPVDFETGVMRGVFHPGNGQLYGCGLYGWAGNKTRAGGFYRIRYTGKPLHMARKLEVVRDGLVIGFTDPLDPASATDPGNYDVKAWNYRWSAQYGSPDFKLDGSEGRDTWRVESATLSADRQTVFLRIPQVQRVMQAHTVFRLKAADGGPVENFIHGTIHRLGAVAGLERLGPGALARAAGVTEKLGREAPGLRQSFHQSSLVAQGAGSADDVRVARLPALFVPAGSSPSPWVAPGPVQCVWDGFLKLDLNTEATFEVAGQGKVRLRINGENVLADRGDPLTGQPSRPVALHRGLNRFELEYQALDAGDAALRLSWRGAGHPPEPIPPTVFVHDADDGLLRRHEQWRAGRTLFVERQCAACHRPKAAWSADAVPELAAQGPSLNGVGARLQQDWIAEWLLDPRAVRPEARMPRSLRGEGAARDAADLAAFLTRGAVKGEDSRGADASMATVLAAGAKLFSDLGCAACHRVKGEPELTPDTRLGLEVVGSKWRPGALAAYLRAPGRDHAWTRMPDYALSEAEAQALAAWLVSRSETGRKARADVTAGDAQRGGELLARLGCLRCHTSDDVKDASQVPSLEAVARGDGRRGCLASNEGDHGSAPVFGFTEDQRAALRVFLDRGPEAGLRRDTAVEFAARQYRALRCDACHPRDLETDTWSALPRPKPAAGSDEEGEGGSVHVGRPPLTFAGEKLYAGWVERFLAGKLPYKPRSDLQGRMPAFPAYAHGLAVGMAHTHGYPAEAAPRWTVDAAQAELGRKLTLADGGFSCVSCHGVGDQKALAGKDTATVNFAYVGDRLRPSYYWRYVQDPPRVMPGTMMPKFIGDDGKSSIKAVLDGDPERQFQAIWHHLHLVRRE